VCVTTLGLFFETESSNFFPWAHLGLQSFHLSLLSSWDYRHGPSGPVLAASIFCLLWIMLNMGIQISVQHFYVLQKQHFNKISFINICIIIYTFKNTILRKDSQLTQRFKTPWHSTKFHHKKSKQWNMCWMWWHMLVILAAQQAGIGGPQFQSSPGKILARLHLKNKTSMVDHACNTSHSGGRVGGDHSPRPALAKLA
jgi:hypothetical protein